MKISNLPEILHKTCQGNIEGMAFVGGSPIYDHRGSFKPAHRHTRDGAWLNIATWENRQPTVSEINISKSKAGTIRGLHTMRIAPQSKTITVATGSIIDLIVDLRPRSTTYMQSMAIRITDETIGIFVPKGCAHGFYSETDSTVIYGTSAPYDGDLDGGVLWSDDAFGFNKLIKPTIISEKDTRLPGLKEYMMSQNVHLIKQ